MSACNQRYSIRLKRILGGARSSGFHSLCPSFSCKSFYCLLSHAISHDLGSQHRLMFLKDLVMAKFKTKPVLR